MTSRLVAGVHKTVEEPTVTCCFQGTLLDWASGRLPACRDAPEGKGRNRASWRANAPEESTVQLGPIVEQIC
ncbi:hypothetical protein KC359_g6 [Hortaea werneckii]|nr:hypothetical protein KC359_g6 [Hortaea werneckii]